MNRRHLGVALTLVAAALAPALPTAHGYKLGDIAVGHFWSPPFEDGASGIPVYGPIVNRSNEAVRLFGASSPIADQVRFRSERSGNVRWLEALEIKHGKPLGLAPWRKHIWLSGLKAPLKEGDSFKLTLNFGDTGSLDVEVVVERKEGH